ncbi:hypothetical protein SDC9_131646 [bioreactor metagenome]|uniref:Uncharacterized protein n=1 Tax=bioreactor metagenome TaxID=1076179 RepID=A0A645D6J3_9ZZZZ
MAGAGRSRAGTGTGDHRRTARPDARPSRRHRFRGRRRQGGRTAPRRDEPYSCFRRAVSGGAADHPPRRHQLLCDRQYRIDPDARRHDPDPRQDAQTFRQPEPFRDAVQGYADAGLHPLPAGSADHGRQALCALSSGFPARFRAAGVRAGQSALPQREGHHRHSGELPRTVRRRPRQGQGAGKARGRKDGLRPDHRGIRPDLHP